jgi:hypothetical protein
MKPRFAFLLACGAVLSAAIAPVSANPIGASFPGIGNDTLGPALIFTVNPGGTVTVSPGPGAGQGAYDGSEDTYFGVFNNSGGVLKSLTFATTGNPFGGFDGDGIDSGSFFNFNNPGDPTGYAGPNGSYAILDANHATLTFGHVIGGVFVADGLADGERTIGSFEENPSSINFSSVTAVVPEPTSLVAFGLCGVVGLVLRRRIRRG